MDAPPALYAAPLANRVADHALGLWEREIPATVRAKAAVCLLDYLSCLIGARSTAWAPALLRYLAAQGGPAQARSWGLTHPMAAGDAAFGNGVLGHGLIREDMHPASGNHIGVCVIPAVLALAERENLSGRAIVTGIIAGYDVQARLGAAVRLGSANRHFRPIGIAGAYGAAAACATALRSDRDVAVHALGFGANFAAGLNEWPWSGGLDIYVHAGMAARNGLMATDLARAGLRSSETILEGRDGLFAAYGSGSAGVRAFAEGLDDGFAILEVTHKPVPGCALAQAPIAAALSLHSRLGGEAAAVEEVVVHTFAAARGYPGCDHAGPFVSAQASKMSIQYGVAAALLWGRVDEAAHARRDDPVLARLIARCRIALDPAFEAALPRRQPARVEVRLRDGRVLTAALAGTPWLSDEAVEERFRDEAATALGSAMAARVAAAAHGLWEMDDAGPFFRLLAEAGSAAQ